MTSAVSEYQLGDITVRGRSLGGFYTGLHVPQYHALFDVGTALRTGASAKNIFISHAHADHLGALPALLGMRGLIGHRVPLRLFCPKHLEAPIQAMLATFSSMHRWPLEVDVHPMADGELLPLTKDLFVRAFRTLHTVPSLGYILIRRIKKLKTQFLGLEGQKIAQLKADGVDLFRIEERPEFAYATDTLPEVLDRCPTLYEVKNLVMECTFLDDKKSIKNARAGCHIHLDQLLPYMDNMTNENVLLMHFSQLYQPSEVQEIFERRCPISHQHRFQLLLPHGEQWWD